jgi:ParB-like nuclease domain
MYRMTTDSTSRLGRGLSSMVSEVAGIKAGSTPTGGGYIRIPISEIKEPRPGRTANPSLLESVKKFGVLQPVLVARTENGYELLAGSRRLKAADAAGLADVPALIISPDRAGAMDVFLEENLSRQELSEHERMRLRDQWVRETGRDEDQALARIPDYVPMVNDNSTAQANQTSLRWWKAAAIVLGATCLILALVILNTEPADYRPVVIPVEFVEQTTEPPLETDTAWMSAFVFPGVERQVNDNQLVLRFNNIFDQMGPTPRGQVQLNQLAAVVLTSEQTLKVEVIAREKDEAAGLAKATTAAEHLVLEGISTQAIVTRVDASGDSGPALDIVLHP